MKMTGHFNILNITAEDMILTPGGQEPLKDYDNFCQTQLINPKHEQISFGDIEQETPFFDVSSMNNEMLNADFIGDYSLPYSNNSTISDTYLSNSAIVDTDFEIAHNYSDQDQFVHPNKFTNVKGITTKIQKNRAFLTEYITVLAFSIKKKALNKLTDVYD